MSEEGKQKEIWKKYGKRWTDGAQQTQEDDSLRCR